MTTTKKPRLRTVGSNDGNDTKRIVPADALDLDDLWVDPALGDGIVDVVINSVPIGRPKSFFRIHPGRDYRKRCLLYEHKPEGSIDSQFYIVAKPMWKAFEEAQPATIVTAIYRDGTVRLWPLKLPRDEGNDNEAWASARAGAKAAIDDWVRIVWVRRAYLIRKAQPGYAPKPDFSKLPPFAELITLAFGANGIIRDANHVAYRDLLGIRPTDEFGDAASLDDSNDEDVGNDGVA